MTDQDERRPGFESPYPVALTQISPTGFKILARMLYRGTDEDFEIPENQETDLGSTPTSLWSMFPPYGSYTACMILHDYLWRVLARAGLISYRDADGLLRQALKTVDPPVPELRRWCIWAAVRWGSLLTRRGGHKGWLRDAPQVLGITLVALPFVALPAVVNTAFLALFAIAERVVTILSRKESP